jgi:MFS family permease
VLPLKDSKPVSQKDIRDPSQKLPVALRALKHRNFQLFFGGQLISMVGTWMQSIAQSWLVYRFTGSSLLLGSVGFASQFPVMLASPLGGIVADRYNRQRVVIGTQVASMVLAFILAALTLTHRITIHEILALAVLLGIVNAFDIPGRQAFLVEMVGKEDLINAIALNSSMFNGARIVGPAIAGILVARIGEGWCFFANAVSYIAVIIGLLMMSVPRRKHVPTGPALAHVKEGFHFVGRTAPILALLLLLGLVSLVAMPLHSADADLRRSHPARRRAWFRHSYGRYRSRGATRGFDLGGANWGERLGALGHFRLRRLRHQLDCLRPLKKFLAFSGCTGSRRFLHDAADVGFKHSYPVDGAGPSTRACHVGLFNDVHGYGAFRSIVRWRTG